MILKSGLRKIVFVKKHIRNKKYFVNELFIKIELYAQNELTKEEFNTWLDSWEATAELDRDSESAERITRAYEKIKTGDPSPNKWKEFKDKFEIP